MAVIPTSDTMARNVGVNAGGIAQGRRRQPVLKSASGSSNLYAQFGNLGEVVSRAGIDLELIEKERTERETRLSVVKAKSLFNRANIESKRAVNDEDYSTYMSRYNDSMGPAMEGILETVKDDYAREMLKAEFDSHFEEGRLAVYGKAQKTEFALGAVETEKIIDAELESLDGLESEADYEKSLTTIQTAIQNAQKSKYYTAGQSKDKWDDSRQTYARTRYDGLEPEAQVAVLEKGKGWVKGIPLAKRKVLEKTAKKEVEAKNRTEEVDILKSSAVANVQDYDDFDLSLEEMLAKAEKLPVKERLYTEDRISKHWQMEKQIGQEQGLEVFEKWSNTLGNTDLLAENAEHFSFADIPEPDLVAMTHGQRNALATLSEEKYNNRVIRKFSNPEVTDQLYIYMQNETPAGKKKLRAYWADNVDQLNAKDRETWSKTSAEAFKDTTYSKKGFLTATQRIRTIAEKNKFNPAKTGEMVMKVADWYDSYESIYKKEPSIEEVSKAMDTLLMEDSDTFSGHDRFFEEGYDVNVTIKDIKEIDPYGYKRLEEDFIKTDGPDYDRQDLIDIWQESYGH